MDKGDVGAIVGMVLGDGCLRVRKRYEKGREDKLQVLFQLSHSMEQHEYLKAKARRLCDILGGVAKVSYYTTFLRNGDPDGYECCRIVKVDGSFWPFRELLYPNNKKTITQQALNALGIEGLAYWFFDDGHTKWDWSAFRATATTGSAQWAICQPQQEMELVQSHLKRVYDLDSRIVKVNSSLMLNMGNASALKLRGIIAPYAPECMLYKVNAAHAVPPARVIAQHT